MKVTLTPHELLEKYNIAVPRYTSYPTLPLWNGQYQEERWIQNLNASYDHTKGADLYIHIPYCESLCFYCGCNRTITKDKSVEKIYVESLKKEWDLYNQKMTAHQGEGIKVSSIHLGGGTPTFLSPDVLNDLLTYLKKNAATDFLGSIEIDPRTCKVEHLVVLRKLGFQRISLGIQDFSPEVQSAINRMQSIELVSNLMKTIRAMGFESVNFDLIYGLPKQNLDTVSFTLENVIALKPDLIAFYSYAHIPQKVHNQKLIKTSDLPSTALKHEIFSYSVEVLQKAGYDFLGMDHFSLKSGYLAKSQNEKMLKRTFMGYTDQKTSVLIGLGLTSISDCSSQYTQNHKDIQEYQACLNKGSLPIVLTHYITEDEALIRSVIQELMCYKIVNLKEFFEYFQGEKFLPFVTHELEKLEQDGLLVMKNDELHVTDQGVHFLRIIASIFDYNLYKEKNKDNSVEIKSIIFSQTL